MGEVSERYCAIVQVGGSGEYAQNHCLSRHARQ